MNVTHTVAASADELRFRPHGTVHHPGDLLACSLTTAPDDETIPPALRGRRVVDVLGLWAGEIATHQGLERTH